MPGARPFLALHGIVKDYPGTRALDGIDCQFESGSLHALVGENGAGKSTLVKILAGDVQPDAGWIEIAAQRVVIGDPRQARRLGIAVVHQELALAPDLSVAENLELGRWPRGRWGLVDRHRMIEQARRALAAVGADLDPDAPVRGLSVAACQQVEIARAMALEARLLVLDEPSAVLTPHELESLFALLRDLRARGAAIVFISHRLEEIFALADRVTILRDGRHVATHAVANVDRAQLVREMVGRDLETQTVVPSAIERKAAPVLEVRDLDVAGRVRNVSFTVHAGEVLALAGLVGAGRSSVLGALFGATAARAGMLRVGDVSGPFVSPRQAMDAGIAYVPEDRKLQALLLERSVAENVTLAGLATHQRPWWLDQGREDIMVRDRLVDLQVKPADPHIDARALSGGNQQKVLLARWMGRRHKVVLLDEPTRGVDVGTKAEIHAVVRRLAAEGAAVIVASADLPEVIALGDRIGVMRAGQLVGVLDNCSRDASPEAIMALATGVEHAA